MFTSNSYSYSSTVIARATENHFQHKTGYKYKKNYSFILGQCEVCCTMALSLHQHRPSSLPASPSIPFTLNHCLISALCCFFSHGCTNLQCPSGSLFPIQIWPSLKPQLPPPGRPGASLSVSVLTDTALPESLWQSQSSAHYSVLNHTPLLCVSALSPNHYMALCTTKTSVIFSSLLCLS